MCREQQQWLAERMENKRSLSAAQSLRILHILVHADEFERFLAKHFPHSKVRPILNIGHIFHRGNACINMPG